MKLSHCIALVVLFAGALAPASAEFVLLIPESTGKTVGMYDEYSGVYLGDLISGYAGFTTPICAIEGNDGNIYVSDQVADAVFVFDSDGNYLSTYADASDDLNNIRGISFRSGHLFVTSGDGFIAEFSGPHTRVVPDFVNDGSDPFDIIFHSDDSALVSDIAGSTDNVRLYNSDGTFNRQIFSILFPEQISLMISTSDYLNASFSSNIITRFNLDGVVSTIPFSGGRGVFELGNGNLLATSGSGVFELDPSTGAIVNTIREGISARYIERADIDSGMEPTPTPTSIPTATPPPTSIPTATQTPTSIPTATPVCIHHGDVNLSGDLTAGDAQMTFLIVLGTYTPTFEQGCAADCNGDGDITAGDAQAIFLAVLGGGSCIDPLD